MRLYPRLVARRDTQLNLAIPPFVNDQHDQDEYENRIAEKYLGKGYVLDLNKVLRK